ncbi:MAG: TFIIB-type zinc ribbon-containing protein [Candidatus Bathyarchaeia archaeon]
MSDIETFSCPNCGATVLRTDTRCKNCGLMVSPSVIAVALPESKTAEQFYQRKFSILQRILKLIVKPSEAMQDIAAEPDFGGVFFILIVQVALLMDAVFVSVRKVSFTGAYAEEVGAILYPLISVISLFTVSIAILLKWAIKSVLVKYGCDSGSGWTFRTAASVTGYAYIVDTLLAVLSLFVMTYFVPPITIDISSREAAAQAMSEWQSSIGWLKTFYSLPITLVALFWESYLGGLGAYFGTERECSLLKGMVIFVLLNLIGIVIGFILPFR